MKKISNYIFEHKGKYLLAITSMIIAVTLDLMSPQFTKHIIDDVIVGKNIAELKYLLLGIFLIGVGRCILNTLKNTPLIVLARILEVPCVRTFLYVFRI